MKATTMIVSLTMILAAASASATEVYWTPAHQLAPPGDIIRPVACDLDGDGDYDVSALGLCCPVHHYWNVGTPQTPAWQLDLTQFPGLPSCDFQSGDLGDLDSDGDPDLVLGCYYGDLHMYWNRGTPGTEAPQWEHDPAAFQGISIPFMPGPVLGDLDADGDLDLIVSTDTWWNPVCYVENVGSPTSPLWTYRATVSGVDFTTSSDPRLALGDLDGDGDLDMVGSCDALTLQCWENVGTPQTFQFIENPSMLIGIDAFSRHPWGLDLADFNADGNLDLVIDGWSSGNYLYLNEGPSLVPQEPTATWSSIKALYR